MSDMSKFYLTLFNSILTPLCYVFAFALAVLIVWLLRNQIRDIVEKIGLSEIEVSKGSVKAKFIEKFVTGAYTKQGLGIPSIDDLGEISGLVKQFSSFVVGRRILWVDNYPENNRLERTAFVKLGVDVQTRRSTEEALTELREINLYGKDIPFDMVISDWYRGGKPEGKRLAQIMREESIEVPILFYFGVQDSKLFHEILDISRKIGAVGATSSPRELLRWTFAELVRASIITETKHGFA